MERLAQINARRATERGAATVAGEGRRIAIEQKPLRARPDAEDHVPGAVFRQRIAVAVTGELAIAEQHARAGVGERAFRGHFLFANRGLLIRQSQMLAAILRAEHHRLAGGERGLQRLRRHIFEVHVNFDAPTARP